MQGAEGGEAVTAPLLVLISTARVLVSTARVLCIFRDLKEERQALFHSEVLFFTLEFSVFSWN